MPWLSKFQGFIEGLLVITFITVAFDKIGTFMFRKGLVKPFYVKGHRVHHKIIYPIVMGSYILLSALDFLGIIEPVWSSIWYRAAIVSAITGFCFALDLVADTIFDGRKHAILHHEWVYLLIPAYIILELLKVAI